MLKFINGNAVLKEKGKRGECVAKRMKIAHLKKKKERKRNSTEEHKFVYTQNRMFKGKDYFTFI